MKGPREYESQGPFGSAGTDGAPDRPVLDSDPGSHTTWLPRQPASTLATAVRILVSDRSRSPSGPEAGWSAWEKFYALPGGGRKGFGEPTSTFPWFRRVAHSERGVVHRESARDAQPRRPAVDERSRPVGPGQRVVRSSKAAATSSSRRSSPCAATSWIPTGSPARVRPAGTAIAGQPVTVMK